MPGSSPCHSLAVVLAPLIAGAALMVASAPPKAAAIEIETAAREAFLVDLATGSVLLEKDADRPMPTASMSKMMTMALVFEALDAGRLTMEDELPVSEKAWRMGGSKMFVEVGTSVTVADLMRGVMVQSGNDASIVFAEALAGSEEEFARRMTERARALGMTTSNFTNATGWPDPDHYSSARDLALLASHLIATYPHYYRIWSETEFTFNGIRQGNRNPLLYRDVGADGVKTGHTSEAGYGLTASAERQGRRLVLVVNGLQSVKQRAEEATRLIGWGFREFRPVDLFGRDEPVTQAAVFQGVSDSVDLVLANPLAVSVPIRERDGLRVRAELTEPVAAPITEGQQLGVLAVDVPGQEPFSVPLIAANEVEEQGFIGRLFSSLGVVVSSWLP